MRVRALILAAVIAAPGPAAADRGADGELRIRFWQSVATLNPYLAAGTRDVYAASLILEPLARYDETGAMVPALAAAIPTVANGGVSADLTSVTWTLRPDLKWSDGSPVTAEDAVFTAEYCMDPDTGCAFRANFADVEAVEAPDPRTIRVTFARPRPFPYGPFVGAQSPILQKAQFDGCAGILAATCTDENFYPIGTGPFMVADLGPDAVTYDANPLYREARKPRFARVTIEGGGDAFAAARAVLAAGEADYAWNLQVAPALLARLEARGRGEIVTAAGTLIERILLNPFAVDRRLGARRSTAAAGPHPIFGDPIVGRAMSMALDRALIARAGYGPAGEPTCNIVNAPEAYASPNTGWCMQQDLAGANRLLDAAGYARGPDGIRRTPAGRRMRVVFQTSTNAVRQATQALVARMWAELGIATVLRDIDADVFFGADPASPDASQKFYADVQMYADSFEGTDPGPYLTNFRCDAIPAPENAWSGLNDARICLPAYEELGDELAATAEPQERARIVVAMNDLLVNSGHVLPIVHRHNVSARSLSLGGVRPNAFDSELWNIADWHRLDPPVAADGVRGTFAPATCGRPDGC